MKQKNFIIAVSVLVLIIVGGIWYASYERVSDDESNTVAQKVSDVDSVVLTKKVTNIGSLVKQGGNYTCSLNTIADSGKTTGTVYASSGKTRFDFRAQGIDGVVTNVHTIRDGSVAYTWVDGQTKGTKTAIKSSGAVTPQPSGGVIQVNDDEQVSSECRPWVPVASMFVVPKGITF